MRCDVLQRDFVSVARIAFQACSFNHSDISPFKCPPPRRSRFGATSRRSPCGFLAGEGGWNQQFTGRRRPAQPQTVIGHLDEGVDSALVWPFFIASAAEAVPLRAVLRRAASGASIRPHASELPKPWNNL